MNVEIHTIIKSMSLQYFFSSSFLHIVYQLLFITIVYHYYLSLLFITIVYHYCVSCRRETRLISIVQCLWLNYRLKVGYFCLGVILVKKLFCFCVILAFVATVIWSVNTQKLTCLNNSSLSGQTINSVQVVDAYATCTYVINNSLCRPFRTVVL